MLPVFHRNLDITEQKTSRAKLAIFKFNQTFMNIRLCTKWEATKRRLYLYVLTILVIIYTILIMMTYAVTAVGKPYLTAVLQVLYTKEEGCVINALDCPTLANSRKKQTCNNQAAIGIPYYVHVQHQSSLKTRASHPLKFIPPHIQIQLLAENYH